jgi:hypothetical protein
LLAALAENQELETKAQRRRIRIGGFGSWSQSVELKRTVGQQEFI